MAPAATAADRPTRAAAAGVSDAVRALESAQQTRRREEREARDAAAQAAAAAHLDAKRDALRQARLESAIEAESNRPPLNLDEMNAHAYCGIIPSFQYVLERINEGGDRFDAMDIFQGLRIFDPSHAKDLSRDEAMSLIEKFVCNRHFNQFLFNQ